MELALTSHCTTQPKKDQILAISIEMMHKMGFTRAEQFHLGESKKRIQHNLVINLMNPQILKNSIGGDLVGFVEHLYSKPYSYNCHVFRASISSMGRAQKLQTNVERTRMEENLRNNRKDSKSRKEPLFKN